MVKTQSTTLSSQPLAKKLWYFGRALVLVGLISGGCSHARHKQSADSDKSQTAPKAPDTLVFQAVKRGDLQAIQQAEAAGVALDLPTDIGVTLLMTASRHGQVEIVRYLLDKGADANARDNDRQAVVHYAGASRSRESMRLLIDAGADFSLTDGFGYNPLLEWAERGEWELLVRALKKPARLHFLDEIQEDLASIALDAQKGEVLQALEKAGYSISHAPPPQPKADAPPKADGQEKAQGSKSE